jgi:hypothetical protein
MLNPALLDEIKAAKGRTGSVSAPRRALTSGVGGNSKQNASLFETRFDMELLENARYAAKSHDRSSSDDGYDSESGDEIPSSRKELTQQHLNSVSKISEVGDGSQSKAAPSGAEWYYVAYAYKATRNDDVSLPEGVFFYVTDTSDEHWFYGTTEDGSTSGYFPRSYLAHPSTFPQKTDEPYLSNNSAPIAISTSNFSGLITLNQASAHTLEEVHVQSQREVQSIARKKIKPTVSRERNPSLKDVKRELHFIEIHRQRVLKDLRKETRRSMECEVLVDLAIENNCTILHSIEQLRQEILRVRLEQEQKTYLEHDEILNEATLNLQKHAEELASQRISSASEFFASSSIKTDQTNKKSRLHEEKLRLLKELDEKEQAQVRAEVDNNLRSERQKAEEERQKRADARIRAKENALKAAELMGDLRTSEESARPVEIPPKREQPFSAAEVQKSQEPRPEPALPEKSEKNRPAFEPPSVKWPKVKLTHDELMSELSVEQRLIRHFRKQIAVKPEPCTFVIRDDTLFISSNAGRASPLSLFSITDISLGKQTRAFRRHVCKKLPTDQCFSIMTSQETFDFQAPSADTVANCVVAILSFLKTRSSFPRLHKPAEFLDSPFPRDESLGPGRRVHIAISGKGLPKIRYIKKPLVARRPIVRLYEKNMESGNYHLITQTPPADLPKRPGFWDGLFASANRKGNHSQDHDHISDPTFGPPLALTYYEGTLQIFGLSVDYHAGMIYKYRLGYCEMKLSDVVQRLDQVIEFRLINPQKKSFNLKLTNSQAAVVVKCIGTDFGASQHSVLERRSDGSWGKVALTVLYEIFRHFACGFVEPILPPNRRGIRLKELNSMCQLTRGPSVSTIEKFEELCHKYGATLHILTSSELNGALEEKVVLIMPGISMIAAVKKYIIC